MDDAGRLAIVRDITEGFDTHDLDRIMRHFADDGGTTTDGQRIEVRGCDLWTFRDGEVVKKDSYWKIRLPS